LGNGNIRHVEIAVAEDPDIGDIGNLLSDQFKDRAPEVPGDSPVGSGIFEFFGKEGLVQGFTAGRISNNATHDPPCQIF
jgi:hypothetical protein